MNGKTFSLNRQRLRYVVSDFLTTNIAFFLFNVFRYYHLAERGFMNNSLYAFLTDRKIIIEQEIVPLSIIFLYWLSGFYLRPYHKSRLHELLQTSGSAFVATFLLFIIFLTNDMSLSVRSNLILPGVLFLLLMSIVYCGRFIITTITEWNFKHANWSFTTLIIGNSSKARLLAEQLKSSESKYGYNILGFVELPGEKNIEDDDLNHIYQLDQIDDICNVKHVMQFIVCPQVSEDKAILSILDKLFHFGIPIKIAPDVLSYVTANIHLEDIFGEPLVDLTTPRIAEWKINFKRMFDVLFSLSFIIFFSPLYIALAIGVRLSSSGPVIYSQERIGRMQRPFKIYKFRSMVVDAEVDGPRLSHGNDPRITGFGKFMRKYRLDEIPQFFNVLIGDMTIVGPRPERMHYIRQIIKSAPYFSLVYQVKPGITSWGMVKYGYASNLDEMIKRTKYDLLYISNMSLTIDMKILIYTVKTIFKGSGK